MVDDGGGVAGGQYEGKGPWACGEAVRRFDGGRGLECERETVTEPRVESGRCRPDVGLSQSPGEARREEEVLGRWDCGNDSEARSTRTPLFSVSLALHLRLTRAHYAVMTLPPSATIDN